MQIDISLSYKYVNVYNRNNENNINYSEDKNNKFDCNSNKKKFNLYECEGSNANNYNFIKQDSDYFGGNSEVNFNKNSNFIDNNIVNDSLNEKETLLETNDNLNN